MRPVRSAGIAASRLDSHSRHATLRAVSLEVPNLYIHWRARIGLAPALHDAADTPPERLVQAIWFHQRVKRDRLRLADGRTLRVLHPGFWNREPGPDFRGAVLQFDDDPPRTADVEVDLHSSGWRAHGHDVNPGFRAVALHVIWRGDPAASPPVLPTLEIEPVLDSALDELSAALGAESARVLPLEFLGRCGAPLRDCPAGRLNNLLRQAAGVRWQAKTTLLHARAREAGWEQALWEGLFRALGYKHNIWPMQRLGELRPRLAADAATPAGWQARLLGMAGLLPTELPRGAGADSFPRRLWDVWWRERDAYAPLVLPRALWRFGGLRPANHPQRRLALAAHWLADGRLPARLETWALRLWKDAELIPSLLDALQPGEDPFWTRHWTLRSAPMPRPQPLLGAARVTDLAVNVVLPWLWVRAREGRNDTLAAELERRYQAWPAGEDNAVLRLARQRLLGGTSTRGLEGAMAQQGLLQVVRDFCEHSNALCIDCRFPELVRQWPD